MRKLRLSEVKHCVEWWDCVQHHSPCLSFSGWFYWELVSWLAPSGAVLTFRLGNTKLPIGNHFLTHQNNKLICFNIKSQQPLPSRLSRHFCFNITQQQDFVRNIITTNGYNWSGQETVRFFLSYIFLLFKDLFLALRLLCLAPQLVQYYRQTDANVLYNCHCLIWPHSHTLFRRDLMTWYSRVKRAVKPQSGQACLHDSSSVNDSINKSLHL